MTSMRQPRAKATELSADASTTCYVELKDLTCEDKRWGEGTSKGNPQYSLWVASTMAIPVTYIYTGLLVSFPRAYIEYFPRTVGATDAQLSTILVARSLPWAFKVCFGILPDNFPMHGHRFKPFMLIGCLTSSFFHFALYAMDDLLGVVSFTLLLLGAMIGIVMADVMSDALVANRVLTKQESYAGQVQSEVYICRFISEMIGFWGGALLSNTNEWGFGLSMSELFRLLAILPLFTVIPCICVMEEPIITKVAPLRQQLAALWLMLQRRATWQPVCFLAFFNAFLVHNSAWGNYLKVAFDFDAFEYGAMSAIGASVTFAAIYMYRYHIMERFENPWHHVYFVTGLVVALFSCLNVLLVWNVNEALGIPAFWFSVGDVAVIAFAKGFQYLPLAIMFVTVCPENQEGVAFALLTSITNLAHAFAHTISNMMLRIWPVELPDLEAHNYSGVWKLTMLTSVISLVPMLFVTRMLPRGSAELETLKRELSPRMALFVVMLYVFGFVWVFVLSLLAIVSPCYVIVGGTGC